MYARLLFSVPNGGYRVIKEMSWLIKEGLTKGVSDLILLMPSKDGVFHSLCIEMKIMSKNSKLSKEQKEWGLLAMKAGNAYVTCRCKEQFKDIIERYLGKNNLSKKI